MAETDMTTEPRTTTQALAAQLERNVIRVGSISGWTACGWCGAGWAGGSDPYHEADCAYPTIRDALTDAGQRDARVRAVYQQMYVEAEQEGDAARALLQRPNGYPGRTRRHDGHAAECPCSGL